MSNAYPFRFSPGNRPWEQPELTALGRLPMRSHLYPYPSLETALTARRDRGPAGTGTGPGAGILNLDHTPPVNRPAPRTTSRNWAGNRSTHPSVAKTSPTNKLEARTISVPR